MTVAETTMDFAMVGLGRMGANLARRAMAGGHRCVAYDTDAEAVQRLACDGATPAQSLTELVAILPQPRVVWVMIPAEATGAVVQVLGELLEPGDLLIDGGNSHYGDAIERSSQLASRDIGYVDVGTSGGVHGLQRGYCLMVGGDTHSVAAIRPLLRTLAPRADTVPRTVGRSGTPSPAELGYLHCGPPGAGHFVKMVHNGIEYGMMAALAEGMNLLASTRGPAHPAESGPAKQHVPQQTSQVFAPGNFNINVAEVAELWRRGSVVSSWLLDLTAQALHDGPELTGFTGHVADSGEGRWTVQTAVQAGVPVPVLSAALFSRFASRGEDTFANQLLSAMRHGFGGHQEAGPDLGDAHSASAER